MTDTYSTTTSLVDVQICISTAKSGGTGTQVFPICGVLQYCRVHLLWAIMKSVSVFILLLLGLTAHANNITLGTPSLTGENRSQGYVFVTFDLSWENSWRGSNGAANWDAAWVFVKYRIAGGEWQHAKLHNTGHLAGAGTPATVSARLVDDDTPFEPVGNPGVGVFIHRSAAGVGVGSFTNTGVKLRWNYIADGIIDGASVEVRVFAIEMVYVREGAFNVGGGGGYAAFTSTTISTANATTAPTGSGMLGGEAGGYPSGINSISNVNLAPDNASWPNGYAAFFCMKYEVSQQQYVDFLNTLTQTQATNRKSIQTGYRYAITGSAVASYTTTLPNVACNNLSWADGTAYADWSGLRPMTELEFEKACRGDQPAVGGEYAWGTSNVVANRYFKRYTLNNEGSANEGIATNYSTTEGNAFHIYNSTDPASGDQHGPLRVGIFAANGYNTGRVSSGASYWGIMELSGNLLERAVMIRNEKGRAFTGIHGDGLLASNGDADAATWPGTDAYGAACRGGTLAQDNTLLQVSERYDAGNSYSGRDYSLGFRAVRR
jgi:formylglycine-generating enzyme required for sulfatase activity